MMNGKKINMNYLIGQYKKNLENNYTKKDIVEILSNAQQEEVDFKAKGSFRRLRKNDQLS